MTSELKILVESIVDREGGKYILNTEDVAKRLGRSVTTIRRWKAKCINLEFIQDENAKNAPVEYTVIEVAKYILRKEGKKVIKYD